MMGSSVTIVSSLAFVFAGIVLDIREVSWLICLPHQHFHVLHGESETFGQVLCGFREDVLGGEWELYDSCIHTIDLKNTYLQSRVPSFQIC